jgi:hypothetical protein
MKEFVLQRFWNRGGFVHKPLRSLCGNELAVFAPGSLNSGDGPDFLNGGITTGGLRLFGDIEIHVQENDWYTHNHHIDPAYNAVVLHAFLHPGTKPAVCENGHRPFRLSLRPMLKFGALQESASKDKLPCSGKVEMLSEEVIRERLRKSQQAYFGRRVAFLSGFWEPGLPVRRAWAGLVAAGLAEGLGIQANRAPMLRLWLGCADRLEGITDPSRIREILRQGSGLHDAKSGMMKRTDWNLSGCRPGNKPSDRIDQLAGLIAGLHAVSRSELLTDPAECWKKIAGPGLNTARIKLLKSTVWYPSVYILGSVAASSKLCRYGWDGWMNSRVAPPAHIEALFRGAGLLKGSLEPGLELVHHFREYCAPNNCAGCEIGKAAGGIKP